ncbi:hypothetical protein [Ruegeria profundi]|uniref:hypothetical protein n=1 Tax=Ruegeria profundi TaxID=1685378 RepID=UPI003C7A03AF
MNQLSGPITLLVRSNDLVSVIFFGHVGRFSTLVDKRVSNAFDLLECLQELELRAFSPKSPRLTFHFDEIGDELKTYMAEDRSEFWQRAHTGSAVVQHFADAENFRHPTSRVLGKKNSH